EPPEEDYRFLSRILSVKSSDEDLVKASVGDSLQYTIRISNTKNNSILRNIEVKDSLPTGLKLVEGSIKIGTEKVENLSDKDNEVKVIIEELKGRSYLYVTFEVEVTEDASGEILNIAEVTYPENPDDPQKPSVPVEIVPEIPEGILESEK